MDVSCQRREERNVRHVSFPVQNRTVKVRDAPPLGDVEAEKLRELSGGPFRDRIPPSAERRELVCRSVKRQVSVHHGGNAQRAEFGERHAVLFLYVPRQFRITVPQALPHVVKAVGPHAVLQPVFPVVAAGGNWHMIFTDQHRFDAGGTQFDTEDGSAALDLFSDFVSHSGHPQVKGFSSG